MWVRLGNVAVRTVVRTSLLKRGAAGAASVAGMTVSVADTGGCRGVELPGLEELQAGGRRGCV